MTSVSVWLTTRSRAPAGLLRSSSVVWAMMPLCTSATRPGWLAASLRAMAEMRVGVVHGRCAVRGPARKGGRAGGAVRCSAVLFQQFGRAGGAARSALQATLGRAVCATHPGWRRALPHPQES